MSSWVAIVAMFGSRRMPTACTISIPSRANGSMYRRSALHSLSVYQKKKKNDEIVRIVRDLQHRFNIVDFTNRDIDAALIENGGDIEDNVQYVLARKQKCSVIITNNFKDYRLFFNLRVIKPERVRTISQ